MNLVHESGLPLPLTKPQAPMDPWKPSHPRRRAPFQVQELEPLELPSMEPVLLGRNARGGQAVVGVLAPFLDFWSLQSVLGFKAQ